MGIIGTLLCLAALFLLWPRAQSLGQPAAGICMAMALVQAAILGTQLAGGSCQVLLALIAAGAVVGFGGGLLVWVARARA